MATLPARAALTMPGAADDRVAAELHRVEEVVVDPPVHDVDALLAPGRPHVEDVVAADEVAALDQRHTHLLGEERVLEVGRVVDAGREHDDDGIATCRGDAARSAASSRVG